MSSRDAVAMLVDEGYDRADVLAAYDSLIAAGLDHVTDDDNAVTPDELDVLRAQLGAPDVVTVVPQGFCYMHGCTHAESWDTCRPDLLPGGPRPLSHFVHTLLVLGDDAGMAALSMPSAVDGTPTECLTYAGTLSAIADELRRQAEAWTHMALGSGASYTDVAHALGISRQAAHKRFSR